MGPIIIDGEKMTLCHPIDDMMAIDTEGDILMKMGDNMAVNMDTGELHLLSGWPNEED